MNNLMIDLETLSCQDDAVLLSIGACYFCIETGEIGETFHKAINIQNSINGKRTIDASTLLWWLEQGDDAKKVFNASKKADGLKIVMNQFAEFVKPNAKPWGNGISFDLVKLKTAFKLCRIKTPWEFWNERDVRTIVEMGELLKINYKKSYVFDGVEHDALDDARHQAKYVSAIYRDFNKLTKAIK